MDDPSEFAWRLRHCRQERGMSQTALASGICSPSAVSRWEDGQSAPSDEVVVQLAHRLGIHPDILLRGEIDSRLVSSQADFGDLVDIVFGPAETAPDRERSSSMGTWIARARYVLVCADPWSDGEARAAVDELSVDPLTASSPSALETVELLDAFVRVGDDPTAATVDALVETLTWTGDAPEQIRRAAVETVVAVLVFADMPVAARGAVARVAPTYISETTRVLLDVDRGADSDADSTLPPVHPDRSARDVAVSLLARGVGEVSDAVQASCPSDGLVAEYAAFLSGSRLRVGGTGPQVTLDRSE